VRVNDSAVTYYEVDQRSRFLQATRTPGDTRSRAIEELIDERLQMQLAREMDLVATDEQIQAQIARIATQYGGNTQAFLNEMANAGVAPETVRDFVRAGVSWRNVVQRRFAASAQLSDDQVVERARVATNPAGGEILLAEIVVPISPQNQDVIVDEMQRLADTLTGDRETFEEAARRFSVAQTRDNGGLTSWRPFSAIPATLRDYFLTLRPGEISTPIPLGGAYAIYQLRGLRDAGPGSRPASSIDYATISWPGGRSPENLAAVQALQAAVDSCEDIYARYTGDVTRENRAPSDIPDDIGIVLSALDIGEMSYDVTRDNGNTMIAVMLCDRELALADNALEGVRQRFVAEDLARQAEGLLAQMRASAILIYD
jgi:peptidyl-prolyl cis-trans isomerase SurA